MSLAKNILIRAALPAFSLLTLLTPLTLGGCSRYSVSINENVVYTPPGLLAGYVIDDNAFASCIRAIITEQTLTKTEQLTRLICPAGSIESLKGIEQFSNLEYVGLADNQVSSIHELKALKALQQVNMSNNRVIDFSPLRSLAGLQWLDARGNIDANCQTLQFENPIAMLKLPDHCNRE